MIHKFCTTFCFSCIYIDIIKIHIPISWCTALWKYLNLWWFFSLIAILEILVFLLLALMIRMRNITSFYIRQDIVSVLEFVSPLKAFVPHYKNTIKVILINNTIYFIFIIIKHTASKIEVILMLFILAMILIIIILIYCVLASRGPLRSIIWFLWLILAAKNNTANHILYFHGNRLDLAEYGRTLAGILRHFHFIRLRCPL